MTDYDALAYVIRSGHRMEVFEAIAEYPKTPKDIANDTGHEDARSISRYIQGLRERDLVELLVDEDTKKGRFYGLTDRGEQVLEALQERQKRRGESTL